MPLDPCFRPLLDAMAARVGAGAPAADPVAGARAGLDAMFTHAHAPSARVIDRSVPGHDGDIPVRIYTPEGSRDGPLLPLLVLFHGGGFIAGSIDSHDGGA
ncbi:MAG: hypothetical protein E6G39_16785, partial [Actinobacteria bacterium]